MCGGVSPRAHHVLGLSHSLACNLESPKVSASRSSPVPSARQQLLSQAYAHSAAPGYKLPEPLPPIKHTEMAPVSTVLCLGQGGRLPTPLASCRETKAAKVQCVSFPHRDGICRGSQRPRCPAKSNSPRACGRRSSAHQELPGAGNKQFRRKALAASTLSRSSEGTSHPLSTAGGGNVRHFTKNTSLSQD